jgi:hypothetical protein
MRDKTTGDIVAPHFLMLSLSGSHRNLADNPCRRLGAEADFAQLLFGILKCIRIKGDGIIVCICFGNGLLPVFVLLHIFKGYCRDAHEGVIIPVPVILTLVDLECDPATLNLVLIDRFPLAHAPLLGHARASLPVC